MENNQRHIYWDSAVFLSLLNGDPSRIDVISDLVTEIQNDYGSFILTSSESIVEVTHVLDEKANHRLDPNVETKIESMWNNYKLIKMIDNGAHIAKIAAKLIRDSIPQSWKLTPKDADHLASAYWYHKYVHNIEEFHTYDEGLFKFGPTIGIMICKPHVNQMRLIRE